MATASLAKMNGLLGGALEQYKDELLAPPTQEFSEGTGADFLGFCDAKSKNLAELLNAGIQPGQPFVRTGGKFVRLDTLDFHLLSAAQLWVNFDQTGQVVGVTDKDPRSWKSPFKENIETAVLVYTPNGVVPAKATFRTTKAKPARIAYAELAKAATPEWGNQDKAHASVAGAFPLPSLRFFVNVTIQKQTAKGSGLPQYIADGRVVLTTPEKGQQLKEFFQSEDYQQRVASVMEAYKSRVAELRGKIN